MQVDSEFTAKSLTASRPCACALGMFDGVHLGHRVVLESALRQARLEGLKSVVLSFRNHPQTILSKTPPALLSDADERLAIFEAMGFDRAVMLTFDDALKQLPARAFIEQFLVAGVQARHVSVGYDHCFGANREGTVEFLQRHAPAWGMGVHVLDPVRVTAHNTRQIVSSTLIRKLLGYGDVSQAAQLLGRPYTLSGTVIAGDARGRTIGFPTANLQVPADRLVPMVGTYAGWAEVPGPQGQPGQRYRAVTNIGHAPTFNEAPAAPTMPRIEVHVLGYTGPDFYDQPLTLGLTERLRDERRFESVEALVTQIQRDCDHAQILPLINSSPQHTGRSSKPSDS